ncbi:MAG: SpoIIE family protein phosphatase [Bacteroidia bacterium]|nr:SpoIIE family protein phosphatase [Bacteroidia bacterium]
MKLGLKIAVLLFAVSAASMAVVGFISYSRAKSAMEQESFARLTAVREMKASQIEDYFLNIHDQVRTMAESPTVIQAMKEFRSGFDKIEKETGLTKEGMLGINTRLDAYLTGEYLPRLNANLESPSTLAYETTRDMRGRILQNLYIASNPNPVGEKHRLDASPDHSSYSSSHRKYHPVFRHFLEEFGYYDIFLIDAVSGNIVYTVFKEVDFGTSLTDGPFQLTNLADAYVSAQKSGTAGFTKQVDFKPYHPSYNAHASFVACPIMEGDSLIGVLAFQMPILRINEIMTSHQQWKEVGLGVSGETYIVGEDYTLRNQSRFLIEDRENYFRMIEGLGTPVHVVERIKAMESSIGLQEVRTRGTESALSGKTESRIFPDYRGVPVLSAYKPLKIQDMHWVIMSEIDEEEAFAHVTSLRNYMLIAFGVLLLLVIVGSVLIARNVTRPIHLLTYDAKELARGNFDVEINIRRRDEIGILALSFRSMQTSIKKLIGDLRDINQNLENKVVERTSEIQRQKELVEDKNKEILDSINYAKRLQSAILPPMDKFKKNLKNSFVLFIPKDIVSGDFYWMYKKEEEVIVAVVDCTGHGVPGAMVSVVGANSLERCVREFNLKRPATILDKLRELVVETFDTTGEEVRDGMDLSLVSIDLKERKLQYAGANNSLWIVRKGATEVEEVKADKQPIGKYEYARPFTNHVAQLSKGDCFYLFSDGYADQFGGPSGKKFKYKTLKDLLVKIHGMEMEDQHRMLRETFDVWKGELDQIDDICVIGVRV